MQLGLRKLGSRDLKVPRTCFAFFSLWFSQNVGFTTFSLQMGNFILVGHMATGSPLDSHPLALPPRIHVPAPVQDYRKTEC